MYMRLLRFSTKAFEMLIKACIVFVIGSFAVASAQTQFCPGGICFIKPISDTKTWMDAQQICKNNNSTLPIIDDASHRHSFVDALSYFSLNNQDVWLGATASDNGASNWTWLDGSQYTGTDVQRRGSYYKSYAIVAQGTVDGTTGVFAFATPPNNTYQYICQYTKTADACTNETGQIAFVREDRCYVKYDGQLDWFSARNKCLANLGDLASFYSLSLLDGIVNSTGYWVGLRTSQWSWQNATSDSPRDVTYTWWTIGQPNDAEPDCIAINSGDFPNWKDFNCSSTFSFICQVSGMSLSSTPPPSMPSSTSSTTMPTTSTTSTGFISMETPESTTTTSTVTRSPNSTSDVAKTSEKSTNSSNSEPVNLGLAIGLGVGLGVPFIILIVVIIVLVVIYLRRKHQNGATKKFVKNNRQKVTENGTLEMKDKTKKKKGPDDPSSHYATVRETNPGALIVTPSNQDVNYADLHFQTNDSS